MFIVELGNCPPPRQYLSVIVVRRDQPYHSRLPRALRCGKERAPPLRLQQLGQRKVAIDRSSFILIPKFHVLIIQSWVLVKEKTAKGKWSRRVRTSITYVAERRSTTPHYPSSRCTSQR